MKTIIKQNSSNLWTVLGFFLALCLFLGAIIFMKDYWPPTFGFEWFLFPCLLVGSLLVMFIGALWILFPRNFAIEIDDEHLIVHEKPFFKTTTRTFKTDTILSINHYVDDESNIIMKDGKQYKIHQITMMKKKDLFEAIAKFHPHIKCTSDEINIFKKSEPVAP